MYHSLVALALLLPSGLPSSPPPSPVAPSTPLPPVSQPLNKVTTIPQDTNSKSKGAVVSTPQSAQPAVTVSPNPCLPGQNVTFILPPGITQGTIRGGKFTKPTEIANLPALTDAPAKTTTYHFSLRLPMAVKDDNGKKPNRTHGAKVSAKTAPVKIQQAQVTVQVYDGKFSPLATYRDSRGWHVDVIKGWNRNVVPQQDPANHTLIFFQPREDSATRLAVSITPVTEGSCSELTCKVIDDIPTEYDVIKEITKKETEQLGIPAMWVTFQGVDHALPDVPTRSLVLSFVKDGKGYVISGRAQAGEFSQWEKTLRCLIRSFTLETAH